MKNSSKFSKSDPVSACVFFDVERDSLSQPQAHGTKTLLDALLRSANPIASLDLAGNTILHAACEGGFADPPGGASALCALRVRNSVLECLDCLLCSRTTLTRLGLSDNELGDAGLAAVAKAAQGACVLAELDVSRNAGTSAKRGWMIKSGPAFGSLIAFSSSLTALNLQWNTLSGTSAVSIAEGLLQNTSLTSLNLGWNCFGKNSAIDLISLSLAGSPASAEQLGQRGSSIRRNCALKDLDLSYNSIDDHKVLQLAESITNNTRLKMLRLDGNPLMMSGVAAMRRVNQVLDDFEEPIVISMESCGQECKAEGTFDIMHPAGSYSLDLSLEYDRIVVRKLVQIAVAGEGEFDLVNMTLNNKPFHLILPLKQTAEKHLSSPVSKGDEERSRKVLSRILATLQAKGSILKVKSALVSGTNLPHFGILQFDFGETFKPPVNRHDNICG